MTMRSDIFDKKIMSLIYAENSDEIECALDVFIHGNRFTSCEPKRVIPRFV
jgi:hypothetical protein